MKFINGILKWLVSVLFTLAAGLLAIILITSRTEFSPLALRLVMLAAIGLICSLLLRIFFRKGFAFLMMILAFINTTFATLVIDYFYDTEYTLSFLTDDFKLIMPTLQDAAQLAFLLLVSLPFLLLFRKKRVKKQKVVEPKKNVSAKPVSQSLADRIKVAAYQVNPKNWNIKLPKLNTSMKKDAHRTSSSVPINNKVHIASKSGKNNGKPGIKSKPVKHTSSKKLKLPKFSSKQVNNDVKLMGSEEHVCPYCLEEVIKNDPRGVVICKECGTWHHQDCWDVTGACGVAHRNKL